MNEITPPSEFGFQQWNKGREMEQQRPLSLILNTTRWSPTFFPLPVD